MSLSTRHFFLIGTVALMSVGFSQAAHAQQGNCACNIPFSQASTAVGQIIESAGNVRSSVESGYRAAAPGTALYNGTRVLVGPSSSASLAFQNGCSVTLDANTTVDITPAQSSLCVAVSGQSAAGSTVAGFNKPLGLFLGTAGAAVILSATADSDRRGVSQ